MVDSVYFSYGSGPGQQTKDGCSVELYAKTPYSGELDQFKDLFQSGTSVLELGSGAGRLSMQLLQSGCVVTAVDNSGEMLAKLPTSVETVQIDIEELKLNSTFDVVLIASYLINSTDESFRNSLLRVAKKHMSPCTILLIQYHDPLLYINLSKHQDAKNGNIVTKVESLELLGNIVRATISYKIDQSTWSHTFNTQPMSNFELERLFRNHGLRVSSWYEEKFHWTRLERN